MSRSLGSRNRHWASRMETPRKKRFAEFSPRTPAGDRPGKRIAARALAVTAATLAARNGAPGAIALALSMVKKGANPRVKGTQGVAGDETTPLWWTCTAMEAGAGKGGVELAKELPDTDLTSLPDDAIATIFRFVYCPKSLASLSLVSTRWRDAFATSRAWRHLCHDLGTAPRRPRKPWRDIHLDALRRKIEQDRYTHELLLLRVTMNPKRSGGKKDDGAGALRMDRPKKLRKLIDVIDGDKKIDLDVNHKSVTYGGRTLLGVAARLGSFGCAKELLTHWNADPNVIDHEGWSPLMEAAFRGNEGIALALLEHGALNGGFVGARADAIYPKQATDTTGREIEKNIAEKKLRDATKRDAMEWASVRGNTRLASMIANHRDGMRPFSKIVTLVNTNVTPFSI